MRHLRARRSLTARLTVTLLGASVLVAAGSVPAAAAVSYSVTATVPAGARPYAVGVDASRHRAYVANYLDGTVSVLNTTSNVVAATIPVGSAPNGVAVDSDTGVAYVTNNGSNSVSVIDETTNTVTTTIPVGTKPLGVAVDSTRDRGYVANSGGGSLSVLDTSTNTVTNTIRVNGTPSGVAVDESRGKVYVADSGGDLTVIDDGGLPTVSYYVGGTPTGVAVDPTSSTVYVSNTNGIVSVFDEATHGLSPITVGGQLYAVAVDPSAATVYVTDFAGAVSVLDVLSGTVVGNVDVGRGPVGVGVDQNTDAAYVANSRDGTVSVLGTAGTSVARIVSVSPASGPTTGGQSVTITGAGFGAATAVTFGGTPAASFTVDSARQITASSPAHAVATVDVHVTTAGGTSVNGTADRYQFVDAPVVSSVTPDSGSAGGGQRVTITGRNFAGATAVRFGTTPAQSFVVGSTKITAITPAHAPGAVDVTVTAPGGTSAATAGDTFTFGGPTVSSVSPSEGVAGTLVTIVGSGFTGATAVRFGSTSTQDFQIRSPRQIRVVAPAHADGPVDVTVVIGSSASDVVPGDVFTYFGRPTITSLSPTHGPMKGGTTVVITGTNFTDVTSVQIGPPVASYTVDSPTQITAVTAPNRTVRATVTVTTLHGGSAEYKYYIFGTGGGG